MNKFAANLEAFQNTSTLMVLSFSHNYVGDGAADNIATVLSHNRQLQKLCLSNNLFSTVGMIKITKALYRLLQLWKYLILAKIMLVKKWQMILLQL